MGLVRKHVSVAIASTLRRRTDKNHETSMFACGRLMTEKDEDQGCNFRFDFGRFIAAGI